MKVLIDSCYEGYKNSLKASENIDQNDPLTVITFANILKRFGETLNNVCIELDRVDDTPTLKTSIFLNLRASLLDFLYVLYFAQILWTDEDPEGNKISDIDKYNKFTADFEKLLSDHLIHYFSYAQSIKSGKTPLITQQQYEKMILYFNKFPHLFTTGKIEDIENPRASLKQTSSLKLKDDIFEAIRNNKETVIYTPAYELYLHFSKVEHFGILSNIIIEEEFELYRVSQCIKYILNGLMICIRFTVKDEVLAEDLAKETKELIQNIHTTYIPEID